MKYSPDAYLLHESNRFITFNIRIKVVMKENVDCKSLKTAAEKAFTRFPYYSKQISIDNDGGINLVSNSRTISVNKVSSKPTYLFSKEVNYQPCSIEYENNCIYFNMYHGMCGGCGTFLWIKTTIYEYIRTHYKVNIDPGSTLDVDSPISVEEYAYPRLENIPNDSPSIPLRKDDVWFPGLDYLFGFGNLIFSDSIHHEFEIPKKDLMKYVSENDGSPMSVIASIMVKALYRALPKNKLPFRIETSHNYRDKVGCPKTHHDLLSHVFYLIPYQAQNWPINKICTIIRGTTLVQTQAEYAYETIREFYKYTDAVDAVSGFKNKNKSAKENSHRVPDVHSSFIVNYVGHENWGGMSDYLDRVHVITDGHLLFEILDVGENFCLTLMQMNKKTVYIDKFLEVLEEENIPYKVFGTYKNHLPISKIEDASIINK